MQLPFTSNSDFISISRQEKSNHSEKWLPVPTDSVVSDLWPPMVSSCIESDFIIIILLKLCVNDVADAIVSHNSLNVAAWKKRAELFFQALPIFYLITLPSLSASLFCHSHCNRKIINSITQVRCLKAGMVKRNFYNPFYISRFHSSAIIKIAGRFPHLKRKLQHSRNKTWRFSHRFDNIWLIRYLQSFICTFCRWKHPSFLIHFFDINLIPFIKSPSGSVSSFLCCKLHFRLSCQDSFYHLP